MAPRLILIRHGQASFGAADYDRLSPLGHEQAERLGAALAAAGVKPGGFWRGTMRRHRETLEGLARGMGLEADAQTHPGLDEFDGEALLAASGAAASQDPAAHFRALRRAMGDWQAGRIGGPPERWNDFRARVGAALDALAASDADGPIVTVSSGGPISTLAMIALAAPEATQIDLQMQMVNAALTRLVLARRGPILQSFNENWLAREPDAARLTTYS